MKLYALLALFTAAFLPCAGQSPTASVSQTTRTLAIAPHGSCPITLTSVALPRSPAYLPAAIPPPATDGINLGFRNSSGKAIVSILVLAEIKAKRDLYTLDAATYSLSLTVAGTHRIDSALDLLRHIPLPPGMYTYGVGMVSLRQVVFADGSVWMASGTTACSISGGGREDIEK